LNWSLRLGSLPGPVPRVQEGSARNISSAQQKSADRIEDLIDVAAAFSVDKGTTPSLERVTSFLMLRFPSSTIATRIGGPADQLRIALSLMGLCQRRHQEKFDSADSGTKNTF